MRPRTALVLTSAVLVALVVGAAGVIVALQAQAGRIAAQGDDHVVVQQRAREAFGDAVGALRRRDLRAGAVRRSRALVVAAQRLERERSDGLLLVTAAWASLMGDEIEREVRALQADDRERATAVVLEHVAPAHFQVQRLVAGARAQEEQRADAAARRADRASAGVIALGLALGGLLCGLWLRERRRADRATFARSRARTFEALSRNASDAVSVVGSDAVVQAQTGATERLLGRRPQDVVGRAFTDLVHPDDRGLLGDLLEQGVVEWRIVRADGVHLAVETRAVDLRGDPNVLGLVLTTRDISERKALEDALRHRASHDDLTNLPNRALFDERVAQALAGEGADVAVLFLDLDDFKRVNDDLGHAAGDDLLVGVADRLRDCLRAGDAVARLGGDEFGVLVTAAAGPADPVLVAERVLAVLRRPVPTSAGDVLVTPSIGIARGDGAPVTAEGLVAAADAAMYAAKRSGKGRWALHEGDGEARALRPAA